MPGVSTDAELSRLAAELGGVLKRRRLKLAVAESCTGGWLAKCLTEVPGSSAWFERGVVTYSNRAKQDLLGVAAPTLLQFGAVSGQVAREMGEGLLLRAPVDLGVAITGIAGPDGGSPDKPVGLVWIAWVSQGQTPHTASFHYPGDRETVRRAAVREALQGLLRRV